MARGRIGMVTRSATLAREVAAQLPAFGLGESKVVCLDEPGAAHASHLEQLMMFKHHWGTDAVLLLGAIDAGEEQACAAWIARHMDKPVIGFIDGNDPAAQSQRELLQGCGVHIGRDASTLGELVASLVEFPWLPFD